MEKMLVGMKQLYVDIFLDSLYFVLYFFIICDYNLVGSTI